MTTSLLFLLVLVAGGLAGLGVGLLLGRQQSANRDERELSRLREELANERTETAQARADAADTRAGAAEAEAEAAHAQARVAKAEAERDAAVARAAEIAADREAMLAQFKALSSETAQRQGDQVNALTAQRLEATQQALAPVAESLQLLSSRLTEVEKDRRSLAAELNGQVRAVRDTGEALRKETASLVTALRKPQVRGAWGETQLRRVAEIAGMVEYCDFDLQSSTRDEEDRLRRPDMKVMLGEGKHLVVDSKVPLTAFLDAAETDDFDLKATHMASFARHVRTHIEQLSGKQYWKTAESPEFVVLFMPHEGYYAAALDQMPDLYQFAADRNVVIATPTLLIGLLRAVSYGWRQAALAEDAKEIVDLGRLLHERLSTMGSKFDKLGRALGSAVGAYNDTVSSVEGRLLVTARKFRDLSVTDRELAAPKQIEHSVKQLQQPELVEDAAGVEPMIGMHRSDPDLLELVEQASPTVSGEQARRNA
jgi:DNA recombination protein RmuC